MNNIKMEISNTKNKNVIINVSGKVYDIPLDRILKFPETRLAKIVSEHKTDNGNKGAKFSSPKSSGVKAINMYFGRPSDSFDAVAAFYLTEELHMPTTVCPLAFRKELIFWGIDDETMQPCCRFKYLSFFDEFDTTTGFQKYIRVNHRDMYDESSLQRFRLKLWAVIQHEDNSCLSEVIMWFLIFCVIGSVLTLSLSTVSSLRITLNVCELHDHLARVAEEGLIDKKVVDFAWTDDCSQTVQEVEENLRILHDEHINDTNVALDATHVVTIVELEDIIDKMHEISDVTKKHPALYYLDTIFLVIFTIEFIIRIAVCPSAREVFVSFLNLVDLTVLVAAYMELVIETKLASQEYTTKGVHVMYYLQMLRILRIMRYVQQIPSVRVLGYTVKTSYRDLTVLLIFILLGIVLFSNFIYFSEDEADFPSIPESWWWGIITMTTVGYGDMVPKTPLGKFVGSLCALSGVMVLSLTIPIFVNTFVILYNFSHVQEKYISGKRSAVSVKKRSPTNSTTLIIVNGKEVCADDLLDPIDEPSSSNAVERQNEPNSSSSSNGAIPNGNGIEKEEKPRNPIKRKTSKVKHYEKPVATGNGSVKKSQNFNSLENGQSAFTVSRKENKYQDIGNSQSDDHFV